MPWAARIDLDLSWKLDTLQESPVLRERSTNPPSPDGFHPESYQGTVEGRRYEQREPREVAVQALLGALLHHWTLMWHHCATCMLSWFGVVQLMPISVCAGLVRSRLIASQD